MAIGAGKTLRLHELLRDVAQVGAALPPANRERPLALICKDRYHFAVGLLAAWEHGHAVVLPPNGQPDTVERVLAHTHVLTLLHDTDMKPEAAPALRIHDLLEQPSPSTSSDKSQREPLSSLHPLPLDTLLLTAYSSGSTGDFQPSPKTGRQLLHEIACLARTFEIGPSDRLLATVPPHHIYGLLFTVLLPLCRGAAFARSTPLHAETVGARLEETAATHLITVPAHIRSLELLEPGRLSGLRRVFSSTAPLSTRVGRRFSQHHNLLVTEILGSTETGGIAWREGPEALWQPFDVVGVHAGADGQLYVDSPYLDPSLPRPAPTQDRVRFEGSGFHHLGRLDGVVKVGGKRLALAHMEARLLKLPGVSDAGVVATQTEGARGTDVWVVVASETQTPATIRGGLSRWFEPAQLPRRVRVVDALPRSTTGKLRRADLLALFDRPQPLRPPKPRPQSVILLGDEALEGPDERHLFRLQIPMNFAWFEGHFPSFSVMPGVSTLHDTVLPQILRLHPELRQPSEIRKLKFRRLVRPGDELELILRFHEGQRVDFQLSCDDERVAQGHLLFGGFT